jgi:BlaI family penicillinase repressor
MGRSLPNVTDAEWAVLERLWSEGPATVRQLTDALYPKGGPSEYATVHKLLERLEMKRFVGRDRNAGVYVFRAKIERDQVIGQQLEDIVDKMCGGSLQTLLSNLVRVRRLKPEELRELLTLVNDLEAQAKTKKPKS